VVRVRCSYGLRAKVIDGRAGHPDPCGRAQLFVASEHGFASVREQRSRTDQERRLARHRNHAQAQLTTAIARSSVAWNKH
jgi:hypothetical protein